MLRALILCVIGAALVSACAPGYSVSPLVATPTGVTYEYTASVGGEYQATVKMAEAHCAQYGKHARPLGSGPVKINADRSSISFECVSER